ncbi:MAG: transposase [Candidatus Rokubacteria bacterium]|nr:transposase [Candidatus Rokubacteria bacterium]
MPARLPEVGNDLLGEELELALRLVPGHDGLRYTFTCFRRLSGASSDSGGIRPDRADGFHGGSEPLSWIAGGRGALPQPVTVAIETTGYAPWFHTLMQKLGHTLLVGEAAKIRAMVVRKMKTDRRDARHLLGLLKHDRFPTVWVPDPATRGLRALVDHRARLVRMRTMVKNGLHAIALNHGLALGPSLWSQRGLARLAALPLPVHTRWRKSCTP